MSVTYCPAAATLCLPNLGQLDTWSLHVLLLPLQSSLGRRPSYLRRTLLHKLRSTPPLKLFKPSYMIKIRKSAKMCRGISHLNDR